MAAMLETDTLTLSKLIASMTKEERFRKMKQFYLKQYPQTKHFYESFGKAKRNVSQMDSDESLLVEAKKAKTEIVETQISNNSIMTPKSTKKQTKLPHFLSDSYFDKLFSP